MGETPSLLKDTAAAWNRVAVKLTGTRSNRAAIGARVSVEAGGVRQVQEVMSGGSYYSHNDLTVHFGLGGAEKIDKLEVRWPSGAVGRWTNLDGNRRLSITEGQSPVSKFFPAAPGLN